MDVLEKNRFNPRWQAILRARRWRRSGRFLAAVCNGLFVTLFMAATLWHVGVPTAATLPGEEVDAVLRAQRATEMERIEMGIRLFHALQGHFPDSLDAVVAEGLLQRSSVASALWHTAPTYHLTADGFELHAPRY